MYPIERRTWTQLLDQAEQPEPAKPSEMSIGRDLKSNNFYLQSPRTSVLHLDLANSNLKKGGFKLAAFGTSMPAIFNSKAEGAEDICAKRTYNALERVVDVGGSLTKKIVNVPYEGEKQFQYLMMEVSCLVWAQALLGIVYDFVEEDIGGDYSSIPFKVPQFRFVPAAIVIEQSSSTPAGKKMTFLLEEVIDAKAEGPFRKYINNVSPEPLLMETREDENRAKFLAFSQHVQYWKTKKQAFVSDYQGRIYFHLCKHC